jgi:hypothetical protein
MEKSYTSIAKSFSLRKGLHARRLASNCGAVSLDLISSGEIDQLTPNFSANYNPRALLKG